VKSRHSHLSQQIQRAELVMTTGANELHTKFLYETNSDG